MKISIVGHGSMGKRHERILKEYFGITPNIVKRGGAPSPTDVAVICTPTPRHIPTALEWARRDACLFIEKPLSTTLDGLDELQKEVDKRNLPTYVAYPLRFHEVAGRIRRHGEKLYLRHFCDARKWPSKRRLNHVLLELSHEIDLCYSCDPHSFRISGRMVSKHSFYGNANRIQLSLNMRSKQEIRELRINNELLSIEVDDDLYARQWEWFFANMGHGMTNNIKQARVMLEKVLECVQS